MSTLSRRGVSRVEVLTAAVCMVVILTLTLAALGGDGHGARTKTRTKRDATQLRQIHETFIIFSRDANDRYPRPGLIDRRPVELGGALREIPGRGEEDIARNTTAALYSAMIIQQFFTPALVISPVERNPRVERKPDFDFDRYDPPNDQYWDPTFAADLEKRSHASYAHLVMFGMRMKREWRTTLNAAYPVLGNRGPLAGEPDGRSYTCGPHGHWAGHLVLNDNHTELLTSMRVADLKGARKDGPEEDNFFAMEPGAGGADVMISFTAAMGPEGPTVQHD